MFTRDGKNTGILKNFYPSGKLSIMGSMVNGLQDGETLTYNEEGELTGKYIFKSGRLIKENNYLPNDN